MWYSVLLSPQTASWQVGRLIKILIYGLFKYFGLIQEQAIVKQHYCTAPVYRIAFNHAGDKLVACTLDHKVWEFKARLFCFQYNNKLDFC